MNFEYDPNDTRFVQLSKQRERHYYQLNHKEKDVLHYLHMRCGKKLCWGEKSRSMALTILGGSEDYQRDNIQRILRSLKKKGLIDIKKVKKGRSYFTNYYLLPAATYVKPKPPKEPKGSSKVIFVDQNPQSDDGKNRINHTGNEEIPKTENRLNETGNLQKTVFSYPICNKKHKINNNCGNPKAEHEAKEEADCKKDQSQKTSSGGVTPIHQEPEFESEKDNKSKHASLSSRKLARNKNRSKEELESFYDEILEAYNVMTKEVFNAKRKKTAWRESELRFFEAIPDEYTDRDLIDAVKGFCEDSDYALRVSTKKSSMKKIDVILRYKNKKYPKRIYTRIEDCAEYYRDKQRLKENEEERTKNESLGKTFVAGKGWLGEEQYKAYMKAVRLKEEEKFKKLGDL